MIRKIRIHIQVRLMTIFYYCFIYSCPKGNVRDTYVKVLEETRKLIIEITNMTEEEREELLKKYE